MSTSTRAKVNKALAAKGVKAELVQGEGYCWFDGDDVELCYTTSVAVCYVREMPVEWWLVEADHFVRETAKRRAELAEIKADDARRARVLP